MLQLSSALATVVSDGKRFQPRLVREIEDVVQRQRRVISSQALQPLALNPEHTAFIRSAMHGVTQEGTSTRVFVGAPYASGGKTGTAQAVTLKQNEKYNASKMDEYERDHSLYEAFAPLDKPRVALAVIVENAGFGAEAAAPIARRVLDYLLAGVYPSEDDIAAVQVGKAASPIGTPRKVVEVPLPKGLDVFGSDVPVSSPTMPAMSAMPAGLVPSRPAAPGSASSSTAPVASAASRP
jgi:penicillin-binding protein 2